MSSYSAAENDGVTGAVGGLLKAGLATWGVTCWASRTSAWIILPLGPVPLIPPKSTPFWWAVFLANGEAIILCSACSALTASFTFSGSWGLISALATSGATLAAAGSLKSFKVKFLKASMSFCSSAKIATNYTKII